MENIQNTLYGNFCPFFIPMPFLPFDFPLVNLSETQAYFTDPSHDTPLPTELDKTDHLVSTCTQTSPAQLQPQSDESSETKQDPLSLRRKSKEHRCEYCNKVLSRPSALKIHMLCHSGTKPFSCKICNRKFAHKGNLKTHMYVHDEVKPYRCQMCDRRYSAQRQLNDHMKVHSGFKPFECNQCGKRFLRYSSMAIHLKVHLGERPFVCRECGKAFSCSGNLKVHIRVHVRFI
jgi:uncharacterized Zn-finger protein